MKKLGRFLAFVFVLLLPFVLNACSTIFGASDLSDYDTTTEADTSLDGLADQIGVDISSTSFSKISFSYLLDGPSESDLTLIESIRTTLSNLVFDALKGRNDAIAAYNSTNDEAEEDLPLLLVDDVSLETIKTCFVVENPKYVGFLVNEITAIMENIKTNCLNSSALETMFDGKTNQAFFDALTTQVKDKLKDKTFVVGGSLPIDESGDEIDGELLVKPFAAVDEYKVKNVKKTQTVDINGSEMEIEYREVELVLLDGNGNETETVLTEDEFYKIPAKKYLGVFYSTSDPQDELYFMGLDITLIPNEEETEFKLNATFKSTSSAKSFDYEAEFGVKVLDDVQEIEGMDEGQLEEIKTNLKEVNDFYATGTNATMEVEKESFEKGMYYFAGNSKNVYYYDEDYNELLQKYGNGEEIDYTYTEPDDEEAAKVKGNLPLLAKGKTANKSDVASSVKIQIFGEGMLFVTKTVQTNDIDDVLVLIVDSNQKAFAIANFNENEYGGITILTKFPVKM